MLYHISRSVSYEFCLCSAGWTFTRRRLLQAKELENKIRELCNQYGVGPPSLRMLRSVRDVAKERNDPTIVQKLRTQIFYAERELTTQNPTDTSQVSVAINPHILLWGVDCGTIA